MRLDASKGKMAKRALVRWDFSLRFGRLFWALWFLMALCFTVWTWWGDNGFQAASRLRAQRMDLERENQILQQSNERLRQEIRLVQQDPSFLEWIARERLGMIGENEWVYVFQK